MSKFFLIKLGERGSINWGRRSTLTATQCYRLKSDNASDKDVHVMTSSPEPIPETGEWAGCSQSFMAPLRINVRGAEILTHPLFNKGTAFKSGERDRLRFRGLLPHRIMNIHLQKERFLIALRQETSNIKKNIMLEDLHDRNETLYHRVITDHIEEIAPLIYTPTVGQACQEFATRYRRPRGMYFTEEDRGNMAAMVYNWPHKVSHLVLLSFGNGLPLLTLWHASINPSM